MEYSKLRTAGEAIRNSIAEQGSTDEGVASIAAELTAIVDELCPSLDFVRRPPLSPLRRSMTANPASCLGRANGAFEAAASLGRKAHRLACAVKGLAMCAVAMSQPPRSSEEMFGTPRVPARRVPATNAQSPYYQGQRMLVATPDADVLLADIYQNLKDVNQW